MIAMNHIVRSGESPGLIKSKENALGRNRYWSFVIGLTAGLVIAAPQFRPFGVPVAYASLLLVLLWYSVSGAFVSRSIAMLLAFWALPLIYAVAHDVILGRGEVLQLTVRNAVPLTLGWVLAAQTKRTETAAPVLAGLGAIMLVNVILGIGQFYSQPWAIVLSIPFASLEVLGRLDDGSTVRSWGLHSYPHVYAYSVSLWTLVCAAWCVLPESVGRAFRMFMGLCAVVGLAAVILSAQRSAAWALLPALTLIALSRPSRPTQTFALIALLAIVVGASVFSSGTTGTDNNPVARLLDRRDVASDSAREQSWADGLEVLETDPYFGLGFRAYGGDIGIHNGMLAGWAQFGLIWLLGTVGSILLTFRYFGSSPASRGCRLAGLLFVGMMLVNATFHTLMVGRGDMAFFVLLGALLGLCHVTSNTSRALVSPRT